jgi:hypothetical protein
VAIDVTPLVGARSGIGVAVAEIVNALRALDAGPKLVPYTLSARARRYREDVPADTHFVPVPARVLLSTWTRMDTPRIDHWIKPAQVLHATNYLTPPSKLPTIVSVYEGSGVRSDRSPGDRSGGNRAHGLGVRRRGDRRDLRPAPP